MSSESAATVATVRRRAVRHLPAVALLVVGPAAASGPSDDACRTIVGPPGRATLAFPSPLDVADVDGDGDADILPGMFVAAGPHWLESDGRDGFVAPVATPLGGSGTVGSARVADLDGDGRPDLVLVVQTGFDDGVVVTALRDEAGTYTFTEIPGTRGRVVGGVAIAVGDFDGDGPSDVAMGWRPTPDQEAIAIFRGVEAGGLELIQVLELPAFAADLEVIDLGGDGRDDLVVGLAGFADLGAPGLLLLRNLGEQPGTPPFGPASALPDSRGTMLTLIKDLDGDGIEDIVAVAYPDERAGGSVLDVRRVAADGSVASLVDRVVLPIGSNPGSVQVAAFVDVDDDGDPDLVTTGPTVGLTQIRRNDGTGRLSSPEEGPTIPGTPNTFVVAADTDGDGADDLVLSRWDDNFEPTVTYRVVDLDCPASPCPTDVDVDGTVAIGDVLAVLAAWGRCGDGAPCPSDVNGDVAVDFEDLVAVLAAWGPCF